MKKSNLALDIVFCGTAFADEQADAWIARVGAHLVDPKSNNRF